MLVKDYLAEKFSDIYVSTYMEHKKLIEELTQRIDSPELYSQQEIEKMKDLKDFEIKKLQVFMTMEVDYNKLNKEVN